MTDADAKAFGMPVENRRHYFRVDGGKSNYAGLTDAEWFERVTYTLANGDTAVAVTPWHPPEDVCTPVILAAIEAGIARGSAEGPWSPLLANTPRSVKHLMVEAGITTGRGQKAALTSLYNTGFKALKFRDKTSRKDILGLRSPNGMPDHYD